jgi:capsid protein
MGIPPHVVTGDFSKVNYSSAKMSENMSVPTYEEVQDDMIDMLCRPIVEDWLEWAVMIGEVKLKNRTAESILAGLEWQMPARPLIDPVKDRQALEMALRTGEMTWDQMVASRGKDPREQRKAILRQRELDEEFNLQTPGIAWEPAKLPATGDEIAAGIAAVNGGGA